MPESPPSDELSFLLKAASIPGLTALRYDAIVERFGSWPDAVTSPSRELAAVPGIGGDLARKVKASAGEFDVAAELARAADLGVEILHRGSPRYPAALRRLSDAPLVLYVKGEIRESDALALALVGSRRCTYYGRSQAERLAGGLATAGFCIVSGMAEGIDTASHRGALRAGGRTVAVLGCGLARTYPPGSDELAEAIAGSGAAVSELPLEAKPHRWYFPRRNRLIAAFSLGVIVVEAARRSGALITARLAGEMGKEVYAVPGCVDRPESRGCHWLIREGAKLVETVDDVICELGPLAEVIEMPARGDRVADPRALCLNKREAALFDLLGPSPRSIDELIIESGLPAAQVSSTLMVLELKKVVRQLAGKQFVRM